MEAGVDVRLHSWFSKAIVRDGAIRGVICETKAGRQAIMGEVVIDTSGSMGLVFNGRAKLDLAKAYQSDRDAYTKAKSEFIGRIVEQAKAAKLTGKGE